MGYVVYYQNNSADIINFSEMSFETIFLKKDASSPLENWARIQCFANDKVDLKSYIEANPDKRICFYGAGQYGFEIISPLNKYDNVECVFDRSLSRKVCGEYEVKSPEQIEAVKPDVIIITVLQPYSVESFLKTLKEEKNLSFQILNAGDANASKGKQSIPDELVEHWAAYNRTVDFNTAPTSDILANSKYLVVNDTPEELIDGSYLKLKKLIDNNTYTHVFCIRSLERGGAEKIALNYMNALYELNPHSRILCVCTENHQNYWEDKLPVNADLFNMGQEYPYMKTSDKADFLYCILNTVKAPVIHIVNSEEAYIMFEKYGAKLSKFSKIYDSQFYLNVTEDGYYSPYPACYMKDHEYLTALFSENNNHFKTLNRVCKFPAEKYHCHYAPVDIADKPKYDADRLLKKLQSGGRLDILWASRVSYQKRPDVLVKIAETCEKLPVHFHVWGRKDGRYADDFFNHKNITYYGPFNTGWQFSNTEYDLFLYTAMADGMPNIVLEALGNGLPVLSSNSGGVSEIIADGKTGFLVQNVDDIAGYVDKIKCVLNNVPVLERLVNTGIESLRCQHSWQAFIDRLKQSSAYVYPIPQTVV